MADVNQHRIIKEGVEVWNYWREKYPEVEVDLSEVDLSGAILNEANFSRAFLFGVNFSNAELKGVNLSNSDLRKAKLGKSNLIKANLYNADIFEADLNSATLREADLRHTFAWFADFSEADLRIADLSFAFLQQAKFSRADLSGAKLISADLDQADLSGANLTNADLTNADIALANLKNANLKKAILFRAQCMSTDFSHANLMEAVLENASLVETNLEQANLTNCKVYGLSAWRIKGNPKNQSRLIITPHYEPEITVDDIEVAQFIYLILYNKSVRNVINTITSKTVLILGRFTPQRKEVLNKIREELHKYDYVPIIFDFEKPESQSLLETVMTLAGMSRFIIADVTIATMVREELRSVVEKYPSKPIQPIILNTEEEYVTLPEMMKGFKSILKAYRYNDVNQLIQELKMKIIDPSEAWIKDGDKNIREIQLERENEESRKRIEMLEKKLKDNNLL
jgi:uncharacterized protein YjbI with pentapeptide repeats